MERKKKVLIIDDEVDFTKMVKLNLEETGKYEVKTENSGLQGVAAAKAFRPDVILLDIIMPDMEGSEVASHLRDDKDLKGIPIIFVTAALTREENITQGGVIGGHAFLAKPVGLDELISCIEGHTSK